MLLQMWVSTALLLYMQAVQNLSLLTEAYVEWERTKDYGLLFFKPLQFKEKWAHNWGNFSQSPCMH